MYFIHQLLFLIHLCYKIIPGGHIGNGDAVPILHINHAHNIIIFGFIQCLSVQIGSGGDNPHHLPAD